MKRKHKKWNRGILLLPLLLCLLTGCTLPFFEKEKEPAGTVQDVSAPVEKEERDWFRLLPEFDLFKVFGLESLTEYRDHVYEGETLFRNEATYYYYYEQLNAVEKQIYEALFLLTRDPTSNEYQKGVYAAEDPDTPAFERQIARAYQAMIYDHPELFWFRRVTGQFSFYYSDRPNRKGEYLVMFELSEIYENYEEEMTAFNAAVDAFLAGIDRSLSPPELALAVHDQLIELVSYDDVLGEGFGTEEDFDYGFSAYGALVENSRGEANRAVCDGYSYAYTYLLQQLGLRVLRIGGAAGEAGEEPTAHSWNLVYLEEGENAEGPVGNWYEVDVTWDDLEPEVDPNDPPDALEQEAMEDPVYWGKISHYLCFLTTEEMSFFAPDDSYVYYTDHGYASFLTTCQHVRDTEEIAEVPGSGDYLSYLAPVAEGDYYSFEMLAYGTDEAEE